MNFNKILFFILCLSISHAMDSQDLDYKSEFELGTDNDKFIAYTSTDRNYTYGINMGYRWRTKELSFFEKWFPHSQGNYLGIGLNVKAFTPNYLDDSTPEDNVVERPFAGWSYAIFQTNYIFQKSYLRFGLEAGILGANSQASQIQNWFHETISNDATVDWAGQIPNQFGMNLKASYAREIYNLNWLDVYGTVNASLGNIFTYVWPQMNVRIGKFNSITRSVVTQNGLFNNTGSQEFFLDYGLGMKLSAYNATIQGRLFNKDERFNDNAINHTVFTMHLGLNFSFHRFTVMGRYHFSTGEFERTQVHRYGSIRFLYRF